MSKKQDRSSRKADLPDWADEVTPADEVMEKFYAPTGVFRPGPIGIPKESAEAAHTFQIESGGSTTAPPQSTESAIGPLYTPHALPADSHPQESAHDPTAEVGLTSLPSPFVPEELPDRVARIPRSTEKTPDEGAAAPADTTPSDSQDILFTEFADKWKRYLYPGQLAVMRALYELTFSRGTSECFTRYSELAVLTKMSRRNCINVMNSLVERGFVERLEIRNDATGKGIKLRVHLDPLQ
jgi:hypothetical protein